MGKGEERERTVIIGRNKEQLNKDEWDDYLTHILSSYFIREGLL